MIYFQYLISVLAVWRIGYLISSEQGPFNIILKIRKLLDGTGFADLLDCFYCVSIWVAIPFAIWQAIGIINVLVYIFSISGLACIINKIIK